MTLKVIGGGLAGCEAAWQAAERGIDVDSMKCDPKINGCPIGRETWVNWCVPTPWDRTSWVELPAC